MKHLESLERKNKLLQCLHCLPKKIILLHDTEHENVAEFVLHDLCTQNCFDFGKAAYLVNNPDFDCLKGVAGICQHEEGFCMGIHDIWQQPEDFVKYMNKSSFNQKVRSIHQQSLRQNGQDQETIKNLAQTLGIKKPEYVSWHMKHGNDGVLLYEHNKTCDDVHTHLVKEHLPETVYFLGFCPIH